MISRTVYLNRSGLCVNPLSHSAVSPVAPLMSRGRSTASAVSTGVAGRVAGGGAVGDCVRASPDARTDDVTVTVIRLLKTPTRTFLIGMVFYARFRRCKRPFPYTQQYRPAGRGVDDRRRP